MISYPRTVGALADLLKNGFAAVLDMLRKKEVLVNIKEFLGAHVREQKDMKMLIKANTQLLDWFKARQASGQGDAAIVYHPSGARLLHGFTIEQVSYTRKLDRVAYTKERRRFNARERPAWLKSIAVSHRQQLLAAGLGASTVDAMAQNGKPPTGYHVHHRLPLDDGGTNNADNLILIRSDCEHTAVHGYYNPGEKLIDMIAYGATVVVSMPVPPQGSVIYPDPSQQWVAERIPNVDLYEIFK